MICSMIGFSLLDEIFQRSNVDVKHVNFIQQISGKQDERVCHVMELVLQWFVKINVKNIALMIIVGSEAEQLRQKHA